MHPTFSPTGTRLVPRPANGTFTAPGSIGEVMTWAHQEAVAQFKLWASKNDQHCKAVVRATLADMKTFDQVGDVGLIYPLDAEQAAAINHATPAVAFLGNNTLPADGLDASGNATGYDAWRWNSSLYRIEDDSLLEGFYAGLNRNLAVGYTGQQGAVA